MPEPTGADVSRAALVELAAQTSSTGLSRLDRRWRHSQGVARRATELAAVVDPDDRPVVIAAAWLHDIGYSPPLVVTGFHPLDGARYLAATGWPSVVVSLVAHHTNAEHEARERGLTRELQAVPRPPRHLLDVVTTADLTTSPDGELVDVDRRVDEILQRYGPGSLVHRAITAAAPELRQCAARVLAKTHTSGQPSIGGDAAGGCSG